LPVENRIVTQSVNWQGIELETVHLCHLITGPPTGVCCTPALTIGKPVKWSKRSDKSAVRAIGSQLGCEIMRGVLGSIFGSTTTTRRRR